MRRGLSRWVITFGPRRAVLLVLFVFKGEVICYGLLMVREHVYVLFETTIKQCQNAKIMSPR